MRDTSIGYDENKTESYWLSKINKLFQKTVTGGGMHLHPVNNYYATEKIVHIFYGIYNIRLKIIQGKVYTIGTNYTKCSGAWAVILKAIAIFAYLSQN